MGERKDLTEEQVFNLQVLAEEAAEVIQAHSKIMRFGLYDFHPKNEVPNNKKLGMEMGNLLAMVDILINDGIINVEDIRTGKVEKVEKLKTWGFGKHQMNSNL